MNRGDLKEKLATQLDEQARQADCSKNVRESGVAKNADVKYWRCTADSPAYFIPWTPQPGDWVHCNATNADSYVQEIFQDMIRTTSGRYHRSYLTPILHRRPYDHALDADVPVTASSTNGVITKRDGYVGVSGGKRESADVEPRDPSSAPLTPTPDYIGASERHTAAMRERQERCALHAKWTGIENCNIHREKLALQREKIDLALDVIAALEAKPQPKKRSVRPSWTRTGIFDPLQGW